MAPYGKPEFLEQIYDRVLVRNESDASFRLNLDYFSFHHSADRSFGRRFVELFGEPRKPESEFVTPLTHPGMCDPTDPGVRKNVHYANVAASIQKVTEDLVLDMVRHLHESTGSRRLCMAGGVALNSVANGRIMRETPFEEVFIQPAAGDAGGALGAALYAYHVLLGKPRRFVMDHAYWGRNYGADDILGALRERGLDYQEFDREEELVSRVVDVLLEGRVLALFQGRFEWGPRALGNRSILADPRSAEMKEIVNSKIKFREPFRPFAPVVPEDSAVDYFEGIEDHLSSYPPRYMLSVFPWRESARDVAPAVNHMGTGRLQTVRPEWNSRYFRIVDSFGQATGTRVLVNTSFNLRGEPIVSSPRDALNTFLNSGIDHVVLGDYMVSKPR